MLKILIVEDDPGIAGLVSEFLEAEGFLSASTTDVPGAWRLLSEDIPDAAVIDLSLSGSEGGWDLIEQVRKSEALGDLAIVILTGQPAEEVVERARALRCVYLGKPFTAAALLDRLQIAIRRVGRAPVTRPVRVSLLAGGYRVEGTVHVAGDLARFSDAWEALVRDPRSFIPLTSASITALDGASVASADLLELRKDAILVAASAEGVSWSAEPAGR